MKRFQFINNTVGWLTFLIAAVVYCCTIEPTASFWDCPEFIATGYKLEIGHPPGAPFFMLTSNLFSQLASDPSHVAMMVNIMSALLSAVTILFLFWSITHLTRKLVVKNWEDLTPAKTVAIMGSGLVGALIYTFSDTFWFSAVEAEVYAYSSAFTALVFWLILKWEDHADEPHSDRWLVLIMYMTGLSVGVHLLNLLCLPAIVLVFCYKKFPNIELKGSLFALLISFVIVAGVLYGFVPGIITVGGWFELLFVNTLGMPYNTGEIVYIFILVATVCWAIYMTYAGKNEKLQNLSFVLAFGLLGIPFYGYGWTSVVVGILVLVVLWFVLGYKRKKGKELIPLVSVRLKNTSLLCLLMLMIGYSTYAVIVIRSSANPPMDENSPEDIFTLGTYLSRDQYGDRPLLWGQAYTSARKVKTTNAGYDEYDLTIKQPVYKRKVKSNESEKDEYIVLDHKKSLNYTPNMFFPRLYDEGSAERYADWMGWHETNDEGRRDPFIIPGVTPITVNTAGNNDERYEEEVYMPTFFQNLNYFLSYQCNHMYWRYFMWNFAGRQNDIQGHGELEHGNWLTGFSAIDNARLGNQDLLPEDLQNNKGHNIYYCLPLLLGLIGMFWQAYRGQRGIRQFWVVFFLFFMTGLAIVIYLNQTPGQPRERDYAYAGSFYAYAIWCGIGVAAVIDLIKKACKKFFAKVKLNELALASVCALACLFVPIQMASQNWDDHDRSGRTACRDFGQNYLMTMQDEGNPIIFTNGDNDTFPLWYNHDVEGCRTDTRVCNLSYLQTSWYIDQMVRPAYESPSLPISWPRTRYFDVAEKGDAVRTLSHLVTLQKNEAFRYYYQNGQGDSDEEVYRNASRKSNEFVSNLMVEIDKEIKSHPEKYGKDPYEIKNAMKVFGVENVGIPYKSVTGEIKEFHGIPSRELIVRIDKNAVKKSGISMAKTNAIPDSISIYIGDKSSLYAADVMMLDMIGNSNWTRPLYIATTVGESNYPSGISKYLVQEGLAYRFTPFDTTDDEVLSKNPYASFDIDKVYNNVMTRFHYGNLDKKGVYIDETLMRMCFTHRLLLARLATSLAMRHKAGDKEKAIKVLQLSEKMLPYENIPLAYQSGGTELARAYSLVGQKEKAKECLKKVWRLSSQYVNFYVGVSNDYIQTTNNLRLQMTYLYNTMCVTADVDTELLAKQLNEIGSILANINNKDRGTCLQVVYDYIYSIGLETETKIQVFYGLMSIVKKVDEAIYQDISEYIEERYATE